MKVRVALTATLLVVVSGCFMGDESYAPVLVEVSVLDRVIRVEMPLCADEVVSSVEFFTSGQVTTQTREQTTLFVEEGSIDSGVVYIDRDSFAHDALPGFAVSTRVDEWDTGPGEAVVIVTSSGRGADFEIADVEGFPDGVAVFDGRVIEPGEVDDLDLGGACG